MLDGLGINTEMQQKMMADVEDNIKVRVLLAQALFGNPDILLLDEPTNHLDLESIHWLEEFLSNFDNTVIVVSHDRHFLNTVCTHIADIDFGKIQLYVGNYDFWYLSSQLAAKQMKDQKKKRREEKISELKEFIQRFSSNVAKAKQATSRKKLIDKLTIDDIKPSSRRFPYVAFKPEREVGKKILEVKGLSKTIEGEKILDNFSMVLNANDKVAFVGPNHYAKKQSSLRFSVETWNQMKEVLSGESPQVSHTSQRTTHTSSQSMYPLPIGSGHTAVIRTIPTSAPSLAECFSAGTRH